MMPASELGLVRRSVHTHLRAVGRRGLLRALQGRLVGGVHLVAAAAPAGSPDLHLRVPSTDVSTYEQIFLEREYDLRFARPPRTVIDAGANIGLASVYLARRFPQARIIAVEPERGNFELLCRNVSGYPNVTAVQAALWSADTTVELMDPALGNWGFMTGTDRHWSGGGGSLEGRRVHEVRAVTVGTLIREFGLDHVDILKVDIEGAEREVFADTSGWLDRVDAMVVELHERLKYGCNRSFYNGSNGFDHEWVRGESVVLARTGGCLMPPEAGAVGAGTASGPPHRVPAGAAGLTDGARPAPRS